MRYSPISRRTFLKATGMATLSSSPLSLQACSESSKPLDLQLYLTFDNNVLTFILPRSEMGQDVVTTFAILICEELGTSPDSIHVKIAGASASVPNQMTVGSSSTQTWWRQMRQIGANTKKLLLQLASVKGNMPQNKLLISGSLVKSIDNSFQIPFEELLKNVSTPGQISDAELKHPNDFNLIGQSQRSLFDRDKVTGQFQYLVDLTKSKNDLSLVSIAYKHNWPKPSQSRLRSIQETYGLFEAFEIKEKINGYDHFVFLLHHKTWPLLKAKNELESQLRGTLKKTLKIRPGTFEQTRHTLSQNQVVSPKNIKLTFETPPLPHSPMEPPNASILLSADSVEVWAPTQAPDQAQKAISKRLEIPPEKIKLHTIPMGGAFGRKRYTDYLEELSIAANALLKKGISKKITLQWTREDELSREHYRPATLQTAHWEDKPTHQLSLEVYEFNGKSNDYKPALITTDLPIDLKIQAHNHRTSHHFTSGIWRSVQHGYHAFSLCSTIDEICRQNQINIFDFYLEQPKQANLRSQLKSFLSGQDSLSNRISTVVSKLNQQVFIDKSIDKSGGLGIAAYSVFGSHIALAASVGISKENELQVNQIWAVADCGLAINPDKAKAQIEGGILFGLSACLYGGIPKEKDKLSLNFDNQHVLRMDMSPQINVTLIESKNPPTGTGELGVPVIAPAICNAIRGINNFRLTKLPLLTGNKINYDNAFEVLRTNSL